MHFSVSYSILCLPNLMRKNILLGIRWKIYNIHRKMVLAFLSTLYFVMQASTIWHTGTSSDLLLQKWYSGWSLLAGSWFSTPDRMRRGMGNCSKENTSWLADVLEDFTSLWPKWVRNDQSFTHVNNTPVPQNRLAMTRSS